MRLRDVVEGARRRLEAAGIPRAEATLDAELLARDVLGWDRATWIARRDDDERSVDDRIVPARGIGAFAAAFETLVARRAGREPMAYIRGTQEFYGREFLVGPGVLIPRPETELVVSEALDRGPGARRTPRVADIGTGSGILAITMALEWPAARVTATDISADALTIARGNAEAHGVAARITFVETSGLDGVPGPFDVIVSNPPYVRASEAASLMPEVRDHEPGVALFGGDDGLRDVRTVITAAGRVLAPGGALVVEIGFDQAADVTRLVEAAGVFEPARLRHDLQGHPRVVVATRRGDRSLTTS
jgi:release factor glutamine methyltransferase